MTKYLINQINTIIGTKLTSNIKEVLDLLKQKLAVKEKTQKTSRKPNQKMSKTTVQIFSKIP